MASTLGKIQDTVCKYAQVISQILKVDVEIMDNCFLRLAGTGEYKNYINMDMSKESNVYKANMNEENFDSIFIFDETKSINNLINTLTNHQDTITLNNILSVSKQISTLKERVCQIANSTSTVLITGESGTGKEMFAKVIHKLSDRKNKFFIAINCGAIPESLLRASCLAMLRAHLLELTQREK